MLEETLIRENATKKIAKRNIPGSMVTPPVTLANPNPADDKTTTANGSEEKKDIELKSFDVVKSPSNTEGGSPSTKLGEGASPTPRELNRMSSSVNMVPREQYDALKAKFIENETAAKKRLESIDTLEAQIKHREDQMMEMERVFNGRLDDMQVKMDKQEREAKDRASVIRMEVKEAHELKKKEVQKMQDNIDEINNELKEVRDKRDMLYDEKYQVEAVVDEQKDKIDKLE